jgi:hypothetical protein
MRFEGRHSLIIMPETNVWILNSVEYAVHIVTTSDTNGGLHVL